MFTLFFERKYRILLTRFWGILRHEVLLAQAVAAQRSAASEGPARGLLDLSHVEAVDISIETLKEMGGRPQSIPGQIRVYVIPNDDHFGGGRLFGSYQEISGNVAPQIVRTMAEAYSALQIADPDFRPLDLDPPHRR